MTEHIIFEQYTDMDKNIDILTRIKAECLYSHKYNLCSSDCNSCPRNSKFQACYKQLALCDQIRLDSDAEYIATRMSAAHKYAERQKRQKISIRVIIIIITIILLLFINVKANCQSIYTDYYMNDKWIITILEQTHKNIKDVNSDGLVNCIDYAITYKRLWDVKYPANCCEIVRNYNVYTGWHHLFIRVRGNEKAKWIFIEPQGTRFNYKMYDYWKNKYDSTYNILYETKMWLTRGKL